MIYFDNGATTLPKPSCVLQAAREAAFLGNPGRGGHKAALEGARLLYDVRQRLCLHFDAPAPDHICFFSGATEALNRVIKSLVPPGGRILLSDMEHNAVRRPALSLLKKGVTVDYFCGYGSEEQILSSFAKQLCKGPDLVVFLHTSNVCPQTLPAKKLCALCHEKKILSVIDCAQAAGHVPLSLKELSADGLCLAGHKGLFGLQGVGALICSERLKRALEKAETLVEGGAGIASFEEGMPPFLPERLEAGTLPLPDIASLGAGVAFVEHMGYGDIGARLRKLSRECAAGLSEIAGIRLVAAGARGIGPLLFDTDLQDNAALAAALSDRGVFVREGIHCAPLAHMRIGSDRRGGIRVSFSPMNSLSQVESFLCILRQEYSLLKAK
ncbi:MAG: aminotransferase class V-fold PLP-dependent enzyme [Clostridia bacterium]|nr:aminotransferase class V-fold PLP-dependent enzyme [Clostridia bacterium]